jgi:hypothetical protein
MALRIVLLVVLILLLPTILVLAVRGTKAGTAWVKQRLARKAVSTSAPADALGVVANAAEANG